MRFVWTPMSRSLVNVGPSEQEHSTACIRTLEDLNIAGRRCIEAINECSARSLNDCSEFALCEDAKEGYVCSCRSGYVDASPNATHYPGRVCRKPVEKITLTDFTSSFSHDSCDPKRSSCGANEVCTDRGQRGHFACQCAENAFRYEDGTCRFCKGTSAFSSCRPPKNSVDNSKQAVALKKD
ncbi:EGF-like domain protein [Necator americanus]|uniref:EGF-like domain protein n=1 Tax=Necator americanus TaxID=51031 RepID=W2SI02_NECAM|nr:EGF-like domain protein [Necator americanus]ETN68367.1 EGF-like domain protein [Necator americanus]